MRKIILYIATSLNGKITAKDGSVEWLEQIPNPKKENYGYDDFYASVDTTIQGFNTYQQIIDWGIKFPYPTTKNYVITRKKNLKNTKDVEFISENHIQEIKKLKEAPGKDIWLIGGGQINTMLLNTGLIDEIRTFIMPIVLSEGVSLFEALPNQTMIQHKKTQTYESGVVEIIYEIKSEGL